MMDKLWMIAAAGGLTGVLYALSMVSIPRRGWLRFAERVACGIGLCWLCRVLLSPLGLSIPQGPMSAMAAGYLGLPGAALSAFLAGWP